MSSLFPDPTSTVHLAVTCGSPLAEVFLIDHDFSLVDRSLARLDADVQPGVYKLKATLGETTAERLVVLDHDEQIDLSAELAVPSAAPVEGTAKTHEFHMAAAERESADVSLERGTGASIFLLTRRWTGRTPADGSREGLSISGLSLHYLDGRTFADLAGTTGFDPVRGTGVSVDPGIYLLRWSDTSGMVAEQAVPALRDWQTQVFLLENVHPSTGAATHDVSILMSRHAFDPGGEIPRRVEEARSALAEERNVASRAISESLFAKFENPMEGLYGAHLMLLTRRAIAQRDEASSRSPGRGRLRAPVDFDQGLFDRAVGNLGDLLGIDNPDVVALSTKTSDRGPDDHVVITAPPMLWRSWALLIDATNEHQGLVPVDLWRHVRRMLPARPFLIWSPDEADGADWEQELAPSLTVARNEEDLRRLTKQLLAPRAALEELSGGAAGAGA
jgi:hypothetical protein